MRVTTVILLILTLGLTVGCGKFRTYNGPEITHVVVDKGARRMHLLSGPEVIKTYRVGLGFAPDGHKVVEGDGKTPEGRYTIDRRNPNSQFHLSIGISYPNPNDIAKARALGKNQAVTFSFMVAPRNTGMANATGQLAASPSRTARWKISMLWSKMAHRSPSESDVSWRYPPTTIVHQILPDFS